jgi:hypothetical protein
MDDVVKILLENGADVNFQSSTSVFTISTQPLLQAANNGETSF